VTVLIEAPPSVRVSLRRLRASDQGAVEEMHGRCSAASRRMRYFSAKPSLPPRLFGVFLDRSRGTTLVVEGPEGEVIALGHMMYVSDPGVAEPAFLVEDAWQGRGLGRAVLAPGIAAADAAGLHPVKINAVAMRGVNDDEVVALTRFAVERGYQMRFIEQMPLDGGHTWDRTAMVTQAEILERLPAAFALTEVPGRGAAPAELWYVDGGPATVGVIATVTRKFCGTCDRIRLTADGMLRSCLFSDQEFDVRQAMRAGADDAEIAAIWRGAMWQKWAGHGIESENFVPPERTMGAIGG